METSANKCLSIIEVGLKHIQHLQSPLEIVPKRTRQCRGGSGQRSTLRRCLLSEALHEAVDMHHALVHIKLGRKIDEVE